MSRSYKKNAIIKDKSRSRQKLAHHVTRMIVRNTLNSGIDYEDMLFPNSRSIELVDPWDISDWEIRLPNREYWYYQMMNGKLYSNPITEEDKRKYKSK